MNEQQNHLQNEERAKSPNRRRLILIPIILLLVLGAIVYWLLSRGKESTDDAQIQGDLVPISPRVSGYVDRILVQDNQPVEAGQLLVQMDTRDLRAALKKAEADLAAARAQAAAASSQTALTERTAPANESQAGAGVAIARSGVAATERQLRAAQAQYDSALAGVEAARNAVDSAAAEVRAAEAQVGAAEGALKQAKAGVEAAQAQARRTSADLTRARELFKGGAIPKQQLDAAEEANTSAQAALEAARSNVESAEAVVKQARARKSSAAAALQQAEARLRSAQAAAVQAKAGVSVAQAATSEARGQLAQAEALLSGASTVPEQISLSKSQQAAARARIRQAEAQVRATKLQLSYTDIRAPVEGIVSQKTVQKGQFVQPGQMLMALVPLRNVWVVANFKETQLQNIREGQRAIVEVDTYPGRKLRARVQSIGAATQAKFSLLPPENATGNFIKVVQRIPVKIVFDQPIPRDMVLRPGQNVIATVIF